MLIKRLFISVDIVLIFLLGESCFASKSRCILIWNRGGEVEATWREGGRTHHRSGCRESIAAGAENPP